MDYRQIKDEAKNSLVGNRLMFLVAIIVVGLISGLSAYILIGIIIAPALSVGLYYMGSDLLNNKELDFNRLFDPLKDINYLFKLFGLALLIGLYILLGTLLFIIPGIIFAYRYTFSLYIMGDNPELTIGEAMQKSKDMMYGYKWDLFVFHLSFIGHYLLSIITFGIYGIYVLPYIQLATFNYYKTLSNKIYPKTDSIEMNEDFDYSFE